MRGAPYSRSHHARDLVQWSAEQRQVTGAPFLAAADDRPTTPDARSC